MDSQISSFNLNNYCNTVGGEALGLSSCEAYRDYVKKGRWPQYIF